MANNPQIGDNQKAPFTITEFDSKNFPVLPAAGDTVTVVPSDTNAVSVVMDPTPASGTVASGFIVGGNPTANVDIVATVTHADGTTLTATDTVDIVAGAASSLAFGLGAPIPQ